MFHHVKELQFNACVSGPDPKFASLLLEGLNEHVKESAEKSSRAHLLQFTDDR